MQVQLSDVRTLWDKVVGSVLGIEPSTREAPGQLLVTAPHIRIERKIDGFAHDFAQATSGSSSSIPASASAKPLNKPPVQTQSLG